MKVVNFIKKNYRIINVIILCICIYAIFFPIISELMEKILPTLTKCPYLSLTGKPCPLCGGTRFIKNIPNEIKNISYFFNFFGFIFILLILEIVFRIVNIIRKNWSDKIVKIDIMLHTFLAIIYIVYIIWYLF